MAALQEAEYGDGRDYTFGSPHLQHRRIREGIERDLTQLVRSSIESTGRCRAVEVGAGHGSFTATLLAAGATVTVTEMSEPSVKVLRARFDMNPSAQIVYDPDATQASVAVDSGCDLLVFVSVLHHIPDYLDVVHSLSEGVAAGGALYTVQDPIWYPGATLGELARMHGSYYLWRMGQGDIGRALKTRIRRLRGIYDDSSAADMVEYHVVRQGVDQESLASMLRSHYDQVRLWTYWSTQSSLLQRVGERLNWTSTFGVVARDRSTPSGATPSAVVTTDH